MAEFDITPFDETTFNGTVRLFPLPNLVLFPNAVQPLHIFEPRYRVMLEDALAGDRLIAMALLRPDDEDNYFGVPAVEPTLCVGQILSAVKLPDGRSNILLGGVRRAQIVEELETDLAYRQARVQLIEDFYPDEKEHMELLTDELTEALDCWLPDILRHDEQFRAIFEGSLPLGVLSDVVSNCLPLSVSVKQQLLEEPDVEQRGLMLLDSIAELEDCDEMAGLEPDADTVHDVLRPTSGNERTFPPKFSPN